MVGTHAQGYTVPTSIASFQKLCARTCAFQLCGFDAWSCNPMAEDWRLTISLQLLFRHYQPNHVVKFYRTNLLIVQLYARQMMRKGEKGWKSKLDFEGNYVMYPLYLCRVWQRTNAQECEYGVCNKCAETA